jgi:hypothetical protein
MKCPVCGINHRTLETACSCIALIRNQYTFWVITYSARPANSEQTMEEMITTSKISSVENYRADKARYEEIVAYERHFNE